MPDLFGKLSSDFILPFQFCNSSKCVKRNQQHFFEKEETKTKNYPKLQFFSTFMTLVTRTVKLSVVSCLWLIRLSIIKSCYYKVRVIFLGYVKII